MLIAAVLAMLGVAVFALPALAQVDLGLEYGTELGLTTTDIRVTIGRIINAFLGVLGIVAVLIVLYAGFLWMTAGGDAQRVQTAKRWLINGVIGLIIILSSYAIASFVLNAVIQGTVGGPGGGPGGCPPGQTCSIPPGGGGGFRVQSIVPYGSGPGDDGWPKNYAVVASFTAPVAEATVNASSFIVWQCNPRLSGGDPQPFNESDCDTTVSGTRTVDGNRIIFKPDSSPEDDPTDFEGEYWYMVRAVGVDITDVSGRVLICPPSLPGEEGDISSDRVQRDLCDRAMAFNDQRDTSPPTVRLDAPASSPAYCADVIPVVARATDDFMPQRVDFRIDGGTDGLMNGSYDPMASQSNADLENPFVTDDIFIDTAVLVPGQTYTLTATAWDPVPQSSDTASRDFTVAYAHCCNGVLDADLGEEAIDCGGECGACDGSMCTEDEECASGFCNPETGRCESRPVIEGMSPGAAGAGSLVTLSGQFFGNRIGTVVFLGGDTDGDGEVAGDDDDVVAAACASGAWDYAEVVIQVPTGAVDGPIELFTAAGASDRTDDDHGPLLGAFDVNTTVLPSICWLEPSTDSFSRPFIIHGVGFGDDKGASYATMGGVTLETSAISWSDTAINAVTPPTLSEDIYKVKAVIGGVSSNMVDFTLRRDSSVEGPRIIGIDPAQGSPGTYVTVSGSGFGSTPGIVRFTRGDDEARGESPACAESWHDNYVVIKVPGRLFPDETEIEPIPSAFSVSIETASPSQTSNTVPFTINNDPLSPGLCSITPDNGPPGTSFAILGEGFGDDGPSVAPAPADPENLVRFYVSAASTMAVSLYSGWNDGGISGWVPGDFADRATWPASGPVHVVADNTASSNSIPFMVQDCNEGGVCAEGTTCCSSGVCQESCEPEARDSAYGWWLSTDVLPRWPQVVRETCLLTPYPNSADGCKNARVRAPFTDDMDAATFVPDETIRLVECGDGSSAVCPAEGGAVPVRLVSVTERSVVFAPTFAYPEEGHPDAGTSYFKEGFWYQATLVSDPAAGAGITDDLGRYLDGDFDRKPGGNYVWRFRISADRGDTCAVTSLEVSPDRFTVDHQGPPRSPEESPFAAFPEAANCNLLECEPEEEGYSVSWAQTPSDIVDPELTLFAVPGDQCKQEIEGRRETPSDNPTELVATLDPDGDDPPIDGQSDITVAFADPRVVEAFPSDGCTEACTNASVGALFNIGMLSTSFGWNDTIRMFRCRDEACNPPLLPVGVDRAVENIRDEEDPDKIVGFELTGDEPLLPNTYYIVRIMGGEDGVLSSSYVPLTGLNADGWYEWSFRTKADATECGVNRTQIIPQSATLRYVGERLGLTAVPYGPPDDCSSRGQRLIGTGYNWIWEIALPNPALEGFIRITDAGQVVDPAQFENTAPLPKNGCTSDCLLVGSRNDVSQCGNDVVETGEDCEPGIDDGCTADCLWAGTAAPTCGNGVIEGGENCEGAVDAASGEFLFPPGCADPAEFGTGCIWLGSEVSGSNCGNGVVSDGESCDDGNRRDGDGCSSVCLNEGTLPPCTAVRTTGCVSVCGDGRVQPGEDSDCELPGGGVAAGCTLDTCKMSGTDAPTCGNGVVDPGEECDGHDGCGDRCLWLGSSIHHNTPSFCGDGFVGPGEHPQCEAGIEVGADIDPYQAVVTKNLDSEEGTGTSIVSATVGGLPDDDIGTARVTLSCTCQRAVDPDAHCSEPEPEGLGLGPAYGCADSGCCIERPTATITPTDGVPVDCRNIPVVVEFDSLMDETSVRQNLYVGYDNWDYGAGAAVECPEGTTALPDHVAVVDMGEEPGFFRRVWNRLASFFNRHVVYPVFGAPPPAADDQHDDHNNYCLIDGNIVTHTSGEGEDAVTVATFYPTYGFPPDRWIRVLVVGVREAADGTVSYGGAESADGVFIRQTASYFSTPGEPEICEIASVTVSPESDLFADRQETDPHVFTAVARAADGTMITEVADQYEWDWVWTPQPADPAVYVSPIVIGQHADPDEENLADAWVRGTRDGDEPVDYEPADGEAVVEVAAVVTRTIEGPIEDEADRPTFYGSADVVVMLCDNPWPAWQTCDDPTLTLPWEIDPALPAPVPHDCTGRAQLWFPFFDRYTNTKFYYCRDGSTAGDSAPVLPAIKAGEGDIVRLLNPAEGIFREYLFTFDTAAGPTSSVGDWGSDAIGFRIAGNLEHLGVDAWYRDRGFRGSPSPLTVSGYDALQEGRTVYVNAAAVTDTGEIYTNVNVLSFNDDAAPETVSVFNQLLNRVDFNRNLVETNICRVGGEPVLDDEGDVTACVADLDCGEGEVCDAPRMKLGRDVTRWADMYETRNTLLDGALPVLTEGTFLRSRTYSVWPSWQSTLGTELSALLPIDPMNRLAPCPPTGEGEDTVIYEADTCWSAPARQFDCNAGSRIYGYRAAGGNADLYADLEFMSPGQAWADWSGTTCLEKDAGACAADPQCYWTGAACNYARVRVNLGGLPGVTNICGGAAIGGEGVCGDGVLNAAEACELGERQTVPCSGGAIGSQEQSCNATCTGWNDVGSCVEARCGDGIIQPDRGETCDEGSLNGTYGHCRTDCRGLGLYCGDGQPYPSEICDCGSKNGLYLFNGTIAPFGTLEAGCTGVAASGIAGALGCSWNCSGPGPRCGDGVINDTEICDGGSQEAAALCSAANVACSADSDCPAGQTCNRTCPTAEQRWRRSCNSNNPEIDTDDAAACTWGAWACTAPGTCGNGRRDTGEECDDGNDNDNDACTTACKTNVCGDGFVNSGVEACDSGSLNNRPCIPEYGRDCNYCTSACRLSTVSGGYCGDGIIQEPTDSPPGPESCEPSLGFDAEDWICVSTKEEDQSFGAQTGKPVCSGATCVPACESRNSEACYAGVRTDHDEMPCPPEAGCPQIEWCDFVASALGGVAGGTTRDGDEAPSDLLDYASAYEMCLDRQRWLSRDPSEDETYYPWSSIPDACDPDDDNDGVPDYLDCDPFDPLTHPRYVIPGTDLVIPGGAEICGDGIDNDCNGLVDDAWLPVAGAGEPSLTVNGEVLDAFFPGLVPIEGADIVVQPLVCSHDLATPCGSDPEDLDAECEALSSGSTCGMPLEMLEDYASTTTDSSGRFSLSGLKLPSAACRYRLYVNEFTPSSDLDIPYLTESPDEIEERADRGYFSADIEIPPGELPGPSGGIVTYDTEPTLLIPIPRRGRAIFAFVWDGILDSYLDAYLSIPGTTESGGAITPNPLSYHNQSSQNMDDNPWGRLMCQSASGGSDPTSCSSFRESPQLMLFDFTGPETARDDAYKFYIDDWGGNSGGARFRNVDARVYVAWNPAIFGSPGKYFEAIRPAAGGNKYWYVGDWSKSRVGDWSWEFILRNTWLPAPP